MRIAAPSGTVLPLNPRLWLLVPSAITASNVEAYGLPLPLQPLDATSWSLRFSVSYRRRERLTPQSANRSWSFAPLDRVASACASSAVWLAPRGCPNFRSNRFRCSPQSPQLPMVIFGAFLNFFRCRSSCQWSLSRSLASGGLRLVLGVARQMTSLPEVFCPSDGCMTEALLPGDSQSPCPKSRCVLANVRSLLSTSRVRVLPVGSGLFSLRPVALRASRCFLAALRTYLCHLPSLFHLGSVHGVCPCRVCSHRKPDTFRFTVPFCLFLSAPELGPDVAVAVAVRT